MTLYIVGVDDSSAALAVAERAARVALSTGATLHVISAFAYDDAAYEDWQSQVQINLGEEAVSIAEQVARQLRLITPDVTSAVVRGRPAEALISEAERLDADLIFVGSRSTHGLIARVLGSIASAVANHAPCDVYIVHMER